MSRTEEILAAVNADQKLSKSKAFRDRVYTDQPIIRTAAQLKRPEVPDRIREMKNIAFTQEAYWKTSAWLFRTQGKFMEDYTDNTEFTGDFTAYYPTYRDLTNEQLRGYFTWRTRIRNEEFPPAPKAFLLIYMYEMINCIGVASAVSAFRQLKTLSEHYSSCDTEIARLSAKWLTDIAVYYSLDPELLKDTPDHDFDDAVLTLMKWDSAENDMLFKALFRLSAYSIEKSSFYAEKPELFAEAVCRVFIKLSEYYETHRKNSLCDKLFGRLVEMKYRIFESAVFFDTEPDRSYTYKVSDIQTYSCRNGEWFCEKLHGNRGRNKQLGELVRTVDSILREKTGIAHRINCGENSRNTIAITEKEIEKLLAEHNRPEPVVIEIDLSALDRIRSASEITRDKLIVDEVSEAETETEAETVLHEQETAAEDLQEINENCILTSCERHFLTALLTGGDHVRSAAECNTLPSILADSINEKLYDDFSDTVIGFDNDKPYIIEDYTDELSKMFLNAQESEI